MNEVKYASMENQLGNAPCLCEDTEEMFCLRESDDYEGQVKLGNLLSEQYRFRETLDAYHLAEKIRDNDSMLYLRLGGAYLTLRHFDEAKKAYDKSFSLGGNEKSVAYPMGVWYYLQGDYQEAAKYFTKVLPCEDEMKIVILYWNALCCIRGKLSDRLIETYHDYMNIGHHTAYQLAVQVFLGIVFVDDALRQAEQDQNDLNAVIAMYGIASYLRHCGNVTESEKVMKFLLQRKSVWPCTSYLAAWNDMRTTDI